MTPSERRAAIIRVLARIDQDIQEAESLLSEALLSPEERRRLSVWRDFYWKAAERAEKLI